MSRMKIRVPATSANMGCGFDSIGFAVNLYLDLEVIEPSERWEIIHDVGPKIPQNDTNLIIATALKIVPELTPHKIRMTSNIPLERGLGSSSSALVAGIELACLLADMNLSTQVKLQLACSMEGHPDNVAPAILGGLVISTYHEGTLEYVKLDMPANVGLIAYIPDYTLSTVAMRKVLPQEMLFKEAVTASSISNVMIASFLQGDMVKAGRLIEQDRFHEKYRSKLIELEEIREITYKYGAYASYLSGAGSTIVCLAPLDKTDKLIEVLSAHSTANVLKLSFEPNGARTFG